MVPRMQRVDPGVVLLLGLLVFGGLGVGLGGGKLLQGATVLAQVQRKEGGNALRARGGLVDSKASGSRDDAALERFLGTLLSQLHATDDGRVRNAVGAAILSIGKPAQGRVEEFGRDLEDRELRRWVAGLLDELEAPGWEISREPDGVPRPSLPESRVSRGSRQPFSESEGLEARASKKRKRRSRNPKASLDPEVAARRLQDLLDLSPSQAAEVEVLVVRREAALESLRGSAGERNEKSEEGRGINQEFEAGLSRVLNEEQRRKWKQTFPSRKRRIRTRGSGAGPKPSEERR